jgi:hypothetical protein
MFRKSPLKNETLQKYVMSDKKKELGLLLDSKTRWNSLATMLERFHELRNCIKKSLLDVSPEITIEDSELQKIHDLVLALKPIQAAVEALCRRDASLITADAVLKFTLQKLIDQDTTLARDLIAALTTRIQQRRTELSSVLKYLHTGEMERDSMNEDIFPSLVSSKICSIIKDLIKRLTVPVLANEDELSRDKNQDATKGSSTLANTSKSNLQKELDLVIKEAVLSNHVEKPQPEKSLTATIKKEMGLFENGGKRGYHLSLAYNFLKGIVPTSVESERAFSSSGYICNKIRSSLNDDTIDHLCFLRSYFQLLDEEEPKSIMT